jgi:hypothetical protein
MVDIIDDFTLKIIIAVAASLITAAILYLARVVNKLVKLIERHEKILYGDPDITDWPGLVKISLNQREYGINDRRAFILLVQILCRNKTIELDGELKEILDIIKKE